MLASQDRARAHTFRIPAGVVAWLAVKAIVLVPLVVMVLLVWAYVETR
jgi:hypothetical protein